MIKSAAPNIFDFRLLVSSSGLLCQVSINCWDVLPLNRSDYFIQIEVSNKSQKSKEKSKKF